MRLDESLSHGVRGALRLYGGVKAVAMVASLRRGERVAPSNITRWVKLRASLPDEAIQAIMNAIDLPDGPDAPPRAGTVLRWDLSSPKPDLAAALALYLPSGGRVHRGPWCGRKGDLFLPIEFGIGPPPCDVHLLTDGRTRAILRTPCDVDIAWPEAIAEAQVPFDCRVEDLRVWWDGDIPADTFDVALRRDYVGWGDVVKAAKDAGLSPRAALRVLGDGR